MTSVNSQNDFDRWASSYDQHVTDDGLFPFDGYDRILQRICALASPRSGLVLELGTGTGNLTKRLADHGADVWGLDFSEAMLAEARKKAPSAHLAQADLLAAFPNSYDRHFPVIVSSYVFHEFITADKWALLQRLIVDHLSPNGRIIIGDIGFPDAGARDAARVAAGERWDEEHYWLADETQTMAATLGLDLTVEQISNCGLMLIFSPQFP